MNNYELLLKDTEFIGIVEDNIDPDKKQRIRVRIPYLHGSKNDIPTNALPWAQATKDTSGITYSVPENNKIVIVTFPNGNAYYPVYKNAQHLNTNLQKKIETYDGDDYASFVALCYNYNMQICFDKEQFDLYYKKNGLKIKEDEIILQKKDPNTKIKIGNENADQSMMLGDNWMDFFNEFIRVLPNAYLCTTAGSPAIPSPQLLQLIGKYHAQKTEILSKTVFVVDNLDRTTNDIDVDNQIGDKFEIIEETKTLTIQQTDNQINEQTQNTQNPVRTDVAKTSDDAAVSAKTDVYTIVEPDAYIKNVSPSPPIEDPTIDPEIFNFTEQDFSYINDEDYYINEQTSDEEYDESDIYWGDGYNESQNVNTESGSGNTESGSGNTESGSGTNYTLTQGSNDDLFFNYKNCQFNPANKTKRYTENYSLYIDHTKIRLKGTVTKKNIMDMKLKLEGGLSNSKKDKASKNPCPNPYKGTRGWHTNKGITYSVWVSVFGKNNDKRFLNMSNSDWEKIFTECFWNKYRDNTNIDVSALKIFIVWGSGPDGLKDCLEEAEKLLGSPFNSVSPERKIAALLSARYQFFINISDPSLKNNHWRNGWMNALNKYLKLLIEVK